MIFTSFILNSGNIFDMKEKKLLSIALAKLVGHSELIEVAPEFWLSLFEKFVSIQSMVTQNIPVTNIEMDLLESDDTESTITSSSTQLKTVSTDLVFILLPTLSDPQAYMLESLRQIIVIKPQAIQFLRGASPVAIEYLRLLSSKSGLTLI